jgi:hypothetical protein
VSSPKMMLTVVCIPHGFHLIDVLPNRSNLKAGHSISHIRSSLLEIAYINTGLFER